MRKPMLYAVLFLSTVLWAIAIPNAKADQDNHDTLLTFSAPVEVPGMVLSPGTYEFRYMDTITRGVLVEILDTKGRVLRIVRTQPDYRTNNKDKTVVTFENREPGAPEAIKSWFYPDSSGVDFIYPKAHAKS